MVYKIRSVPAELCIWNSLLKRMKLHPNDKQYYSNLTRGYEGEVQFDALTEKLNCDCYLLQDLLLQTNNTTFQIDSLLITGNQLYIFEVKNYEGDYHYEQDKFFKKPQYEINNPLHQIGRSESLLRQLLFKHGISLQIKAFVVFINPEFTLYQVPQDNRIILPTQLNRLIKQLNASSSKLTKQHKNLANKLVSLHLEESPFSQLPSYTYETLRKGMICCKCSSFTLHVEVKEVVCITCQQREAIITSVLRSVEEFRLLFPERKITTRLIHEWCGVIESKKRISRILDKHFVKVGVKRWVYYK
ncbi:nuclease-related domain-containing protein [Virgibacillus sp. SK37]|uniref:nuclease-related domain-containing protein n=1 Tax=Virgibacillus sp. SK37 TaxID=403957 RepID=UPI0004D1537A|nr:nuclease-related domain-containing protein [Virgibacillus sp. SK37]AIF42293.1 nuclease [Virgibacillus sp. SK37]